MPRRKAASVSSGGFEFQPVEEGGSKSSAPSKSGRGTKRAASRSKSTSAPKRQRSDKSKTSTTKGKPVASKRGSGGAKAKAREAQMELIRKLVPSAEETPFIRLSLLLQNVIQHVLEEMHAGGAAAEVVDAAAEVGQTFVDYLPDWGAEQIEQLQKEHPPVIIPNPENQALRSRLAALQQLAEGFRSELATLQASKAAVEAEAAALRDAPLPLSDDVALDEEGKALLSKASQRLAKLRSTLGEAGETLELQADAIQQLVVAADAAGASMNALTTTVAGKARAEGFKAYDYVEKPQRLLKKMLAGAGGDGKGQ